MDISSSLRALERIVSVLEKSGKKLSTVPGWEEKLVPIPHQMLEDEFKKDREVRVKRMNIQGIHAYNKGFYPDIVIEIHGEPHTAIEMKVINPHAGQGDRIPKAIGQTLVYQGFGGYRFGVVYIVDKTDSVERGKKEVEVNFEKMLWRRHRIRIVIVRSKDREEEI